MTFTTVAYIEQEKNMRHKSIYTFFVTKIHVKFVVVFLVVNTQYEGETSVPGFEFDVRVSTPSGIPNTRPLALMASQVYAPWSASFTSRMVRVPRPPSLVMEILGAQKYGTNDTGAQESLSAMAWTLIGTFLFLILTVTEIHQIQP